MLCIRRGTENSFIGAYVKRDIGRGIGKIIGIITEKTRGDKCILVQFDKHFVGHNGETAWTQYKELKHVGTLKSNTYNCWYCKKEELTLLDKRGILKEKLLQEVM